MSKSSLPRSFWDDNIVGAPLRCAQAYGSAEGIFLADPALTPRFAVLASATCRAIIIRPAKAGLEHRG
jgi:hypothetical protein